MKLLQEVGAKLGLLVRFRKLFALGNLVLGATMALAVPRPEATSPRVFPPRLDCIPDGAMEIHGILSVDAGTETFAVERNYKPVALDGDPLVDRTTGVFSLKLKEPLLQGNGVRLTVAGSPPGFGDVGRCGQFPAQPTDPRVPDARKPMPPAAPLQAPRVSSLREGDRTITGSVEDDAGHILVTVLDQKGAVVEERMDEVNAATRSFNTGLTRALAEDDMVKVRSLTHDAKSDPTPVRVETSEYNWGRVRAYFSLGAMSSKDDGSFRKVHPFISLNIDKNWMNIVKCYAPDSPAWQDNRGENNRFENYKREHEEWRWRCDRRPFTTARLFLLVNTYFEARLQSAEPLPFADVSSSSLKKTSKLGTYEFGIYAPVDHSRMSWPHDGQRHVLFLAPLFKGGLETIPAGQSAPGKISLDPNNDFKFLAAGVRLGHYRAFPNSHSVSPQLISWIDFTWGRWDRMLRGDSPPRSVPMRLESTGRLKVPYTPLTVGFTANAGPGRDEFSFFAGTRFDVGRILAKIAPNVK